MMLSDLVLRNRSYRRFYQEVTIDLETLKGLVDLARLSASAANKQPLKYILSCDPQYEILLVIALGKPKETVLIEVVGPDGDIKYWRDDEGRHHVPKRSLDELILREYER